MLLFILFKNIFLPLFIQNLTVFPGAVQSCLSRKKLFVKNQQGVFNYIGEIILFFSWSSFKQHEPLENNTFGFILILYLAEANLKLMDLGFSFFNSLIVYELAWYLTYDE